MSNRSAGSVARRWQPPSAFAAPTDRLVAGFSTTFGRFVDQDQAQAVFAVRSVNMHFRAGSSLNCETIVIRRGAD